MRVVARINLTAAVHYRQMQFVEGALGEDVNVRLKWVLVEGDGSMSVFGAKRTSPGLVTMSAFDPKRTCALRIKVYSLR